ncbi:MAG: NAD(P)/FAD-dependent oxidoreductase [Woeseiaceae bacterium]
MFRFNNNAPITFSDPLPEKVDVVVIGGGIIGISTAWYLLEHGLSVLVCDKGRVAGEQSSRNWGWVRVTVRDPDEVPVAMDSRQCWREISSSLDEDTGFTQQGVLLLADTAAEMAEYEEWMKVAAEHGVDTQLLSRSDISKHINVADERWVGGIVTPSDCRAEPFKAVPAIARGLQQRGGVVRENCAVRSIDIEAGKIAGVVTEQGRVKAQAVVCAAGAWSNMFLSNHKVEFPQLLVRGTVVRTAPAPDIYAGNVGLKDVFVRQRQDGGYTVASGMFDHTIGANSFRYFFNFLSSLGSADDIHLRVGSDVAQQPFVRRAWSGDDKSPFEKHRVLNPAPSKDALRKIRNNLAKRLPSLADIEFLESWAGMIDATPDVVPVMDQVATHPGLFLASGFSGHGFGIGPGAGRAMANLVAGVEPGFDLSRFRFGRFSDGSKMRPGPAI